MKSSHPLNPEVVDDLVSYLHERESIRIKKERGDSKPWTGVKVLQENKFTNVLRENDKTTRWLRQNWTIPHYGENPVVEFMNCAIFRWFGTIRFGELLGYSEQIDINRIREVAGRARSHGESIFTRAYIITNGGLTGAKQDVVSEEYLRPLAALAPRLVKIALDTRSWREVAEVMKKSPGHGGQGFMLKEILQDAMRTSMFINGVDDRFTWTPLGPGAQRGMNRLRDRDPDTKVRNAVLLEEIQELFEVIKPRMAPHMPQPGVDYDLHDLQFALCELDKFIRVMSGEGKMKNKYDGGAA